MIDEFMKEWNKWLVLEDVIDQTKQPGLLKSNLFVQVFSLINPEIKFNFEIKLNGLLETACFVLYPVKCIKLSIIQQMI